MRYLTLTAKGDGLTIIKTAREGDVISGEFESWPLKTGKQILFVDTQMHKVLKAYYMNGNYEGGAMFAYPYDEMKAILTERLGLSERDLYHQRLMEIADQQSVRDGIAGPPWRSRKGQIAAHVGLKVAHFALFVMWGTIKFIGLMLLIPFVIKWLHKPK